MASRPKILAVDLDGTIINSKDSKELGEPIPGVREKLQKFKDKGWAIIIWTVRAKSKEIVDHLKHHNIPFDHFNESPWQPKDSSAKIKADVYVDDRAVPFSGDPEDYERGLTHDPWWEAKKALGEEGDFRGGDPEEAQEKKQEKQEEGAEMSLGKAQAGEESGEFRGGDPEDLQQKREEKREETAESGELEDAEDEEEELDPEEIAEEAEAEAEKEAEKSFNTGASQVSPVDDHSDFQARTVNGDLPAVLPPVKDIDPTDETRPGANQGKTWSDVTGAKLPLQGAPWVDIRQYTMQGKEAEAAKRQAMFYRALNHGITFDPDFYTSFEKARKGEMKAGHKYLYREMTPEGVWKYSYTNARHDNHGPLHIGNMQGHSVDLPEGHQEAHDPEHQNPKGAYKASIDHLMHHGGTWAANVPHPDTGEQKEMVLNIQGHKGGAPKQKPIQLMDAAHVKKDQKVGEGEDLDFTKHKAKGKFAGKKYGGMAFRKLDTLEGKVRRKQVHTEVGADGKPLLEWRFGGEASQEGKVRGKDAGEGREISIRYLDPDHPVADLPPANASKEGWWPPGTGAKDIGALKKLVERKKHEHRQILGDTKTSKFPIVEGKPYVNHVNSGQIKKESYFKPRMMKPKWNHEQQKMVYPTPRSEEEQKVEGKSALESKMKPKKTIRAAFDSPQHRDNFLSNLTRSPNRKEGTSAGEMYPLMVYLAHRAVEERNMRVPDSPALRDKEKIDMMTNHLIPAAREGVSDALDRYNPSHEKSTHFESFATDRMKGTIREALTRELTPEAASKRERLGSEGSSYQGGGGGEGSSGHGGEPVESGGDAGMKEMVDHFEGGSADSPYEDPNSWFERAKSHLGYMMEHHEGKANSMDPDEWMSGFGQIDEATDALHGLQDQHGMSSPEVAHDAINNFVKEWNHDNAGGSNFLPELKDLSQKRVLEDLHKVQRGGKEADDLLNDEFGQQRLDTPLSELQGHLQGHDQMGQADYDETEHSDHGINSKDLLKYIGKHGVKTPRDLINKLNTHMLTSASGSPSRRGADNLQRFQEWLKSSPKLDEHYGIPPSRGGGAEEPPAAPRRPVEEEAAPGVGKRRAEKALRAVTALRKAGETDPSQIQFPQEPTPESHPNYFDKQGQKLFQPVPEGVKAEDNPEYDPDPESGNNWANKYQDPETGATKYSYLHEDRANNPKLHHNNVMRYLDTQLPKIRQFYKQKLVSEQPMDRAVGLFLALMDQAKAKHHDEAEGGLSTLKVQDVQSGDGDITELHMGEGYTIHMTMDQATKAALDELLQDKQPEDPVFAVGDQMLDPETVEKFLNDQFGVSGDSFRTYHGTKQYSKEFQRVVGEGKHSNIEDAKQEAMDATGNKMGHDDGGISVHDHIDPVASEALHIMGASQVHKSLLTNPETGETLTMNGWAERYANMIRKAAHKLQDRIDFQGMKISIENKKGSTRKWYDPHNKQSGETKMHCAYGYVRGVKRKGADGDLVDVYVGPNSDAQTVFVIHQLKAPDFKEYDEDKVMLGFDSLEEAKAAYRKQYDKPGFLGGVTVMPMKKFKDKLDNSSSQMIKSSVWHVSADHPDRSEEEEMFGQWLHEYPIHEHEARWKKRKERDAEHLEQPPRAKHTGDMHGVVGEATHEHDQVGV